MFDNHHMALVVVTILFCEKKNPTQSKLISHPPEERSDERNERRVKERVKREKKLDVASILISHM